MVKIESFSKHQRSRYKRHVMTAPDGKVFQGDTDAEVRKLVKTHLDNKKQSGITLTKPKFDPDTGERIN